MHTTALHIYIPYPPILITNSIQHSQIQNNRTPSLSQLLRIQLYIFGTTLSRPLPLLPLPRQLPPLSLLLFLTTFTRPHKRLFRIHNA